jgi:predicted glycogen debranching enzyme
MHAIDLTSIELDALIEREWLAVNKIGGFACSTIPGLNSRKYHGLLVAAMTPPVRRMVLLSRVEETVVCDGWTYALACNEYPGTFHPRGDQSLRAFNADPFPRWAYQGDQWTIEKSLRLLTGENTVVLSYTLLGGDKTVTLELRPLLALRGMHELMYQWNGKLTAVEKSTGHHHVPATGRTPEVFFAHDGVFESDDHWYLNSIYRREQERGYAGLEDLWNPGVVRWSLKPGQTVHFICSADPINFCQALAKADDQLTEAMVPSPPAKSLGEPMDSLLRAADQFVLSVPSMENPNQTDFVAAQYPWSPPSPRHSLIGFAGLFLVPGKLAAAQRFLLSMCDRLADGVLPSMLSETAGPAIYRGADTSLWFINAVHQFDRYGGDHETIRHRLLDVVLQIVHAYRHGTSLGIHADEEGLIETRQPGTATTWMDAQVQDWVVTPRSGKPVEINALWYNAVCIAADLCDRFGQPERTEDLTTLARSIQSAFNRRFWNPDKNCCYDVVDAHGHDPSIRPNQLLAVSLPYPVLHPDRFELVLERVYAELLVPPGVRTLSPADRSYQGHYAGNIVSRDRAYHQGSAFPWLLGAYVDAYLRVNGRGEGARGEAKQILEPCVNYLQGDGLGQLCELFDGDKPHRRGGAIASATSVAEVLRVYAEDVLGMSPPPQPTKTVETNPAKIA